MVNPPPPSIKLVDRHLMARAAGLEPAMSASKADALTAWRRPRRKAYAMRRIGFKRLGADLREGSLLRLLLRNRARLARWRFRTAAAWLGHQRFKKESE